MVVHVILVDADDNAIGTMEKMEAHQKGVLHRALSVVVFNSRGEILLQKRARKKYHSGGLWTNTCCSHPLPGELMQDAAVRTLRHEMGLDLRPSFAYAFRYEAYLGADLTEHEIDHVFTAVSDKMPEINTEEVEDWKWISSDALAKDMETNPENYSSWFKIMVGQEEFRKII